MTAAQLKASRRSLEVAIIEPSASHWHQPAWTLVGAGSYDFEETRRNEASLIPYGADWIQNRVTGIFPYHNEVQTTQSGFIPYDYLIVSPGLQINSDALPQLKQALLTESICSNYIDPQKTWDVLHKFKGGNALFTLPSTPIKCGGAPQKIMYLADDHFRKSGVRGNTNVIFATPGTVIFGTKKFANTLTKVIKRKDIITRFFYAPASIDPLKRKSGSDTPALRNGKASRPSTKRWVWISWLPCLMICCTWRRRNQPRILSGNRYSLSRMGPIRVGWM